MCKGYTAGESKESRNQKRNPLEHWETRGGVQDRAGESMLSCFVYTLRAMGIH